MPSDRETSVSALWQSYLDGVIPQDAGSVQVQETRLAFWAGASAVFSLIVSLAEADEGVAEERLVSLQKEFDAHLSAESAREGRGHGRA